MHAENAVAIYVSTTPMIGQSHDTATIAPHVKKQTETLHRHYGHYRHRRHHQHYRHDKYHTHD